MTLNVVFYIFLQASIPLCRLISIDCYVIMLGIGNVFLKKSFYIIVCKSFKNLAIFTRCLLRHLQSPRIVPFYLSFASLISLMSPNFNSLLCDHLRYWQWISEKRFFIIVCKPFRSFADFARCLQDTYSLPESFLSICLSFALCELSEYIMQA